ncbi:tetratricopeptide repeat protein [Nitratireductor aquimarinus]|uniref:tetratricopeptide repeat protein n=1 Tax=Alphaproteobacteria TaxID=28211 RepID=UPI0019D3A5DE|nr:MULTISPECIES: tetratricopeptide repeat protein [Alphaproteobacteria]MBN7757161.1 tetratricopeptide repeat protein [Nitratireductor aquimarinus]MBY5999921.1 tetratricopeptide repeat protein [Tritonibacter mobilis]MBY6021948.1 tetratricopeptide repeat protein [Nitratireductor sp. DP7N14-4]
MVRFTVAIAAIFMMGLPPLQAADGNEPVTGVEAPATDRQTRLNALFSDLKKETNERVARRIALRIGEAWSDSGSDTANLLMQWANDAVKAQDFSVALDFLDQVTVLFPDYAEGWNRRATVHYMMNDYARSMTDISHALELEPRHFGALAGMARILQATGHEQQALTAYEQVLDVYPMLRSAQNAVAEISDELDGQGI